MAVDIPNYRIIEKLGVGAQTRIYRARCMRTGTDYTVKIVKIVKPEDSSFVDLLRAEHSIGSSIDHPVLRKVYELRLMRQRFRVRGAILFMEYVAGAPLSDKDLRPTLDECLRIFGEVATGLHAMHLAGYVHADLKPNNILITSDGTVKLIDLGQSARTHEAKAKIQGTIDYMAPEQVQRGTLDQRTDVFGLGAALHRVATGRPIATEMNQTVNMHSQNLVGRRITEVRETTMHRLPTCVTRLINDCCQSDPGNRIADMTALIERLDLARTIVAKHGESAALATDEESTDAATEPTRASDQTRDSVAAGDPSGEDDVVDFEQFDVEQ